MKRTGRALEYKKKKKRKKEKQCKSGSIDHTYVCLHVQLDRFTLSSEIPVKRKNRSENFKRQTLGCSERSEIKWNVEVQRMVVHRFSRVRKPCKHRRIITPFAQIFA